MNWKIWIAVLVALAPAPGATAAAAADPLVGDAGGPPWTLIAATAAAVLLALLASLALRSRRRRPAEPAPPAEPVPPEPSVSPLPPEEPEPSVAPQRADPPATASSTSATSSVPGDRPRCTSLHLWEVAYERGNLGEDGVWRFPHRCRNCGRELLARDITDASAQASRASRTLH